jgi:hypothetical protein
LQNQTWNWIQGSISAWNQNCCNLKKRTGSGFFFLKSQ